jgi:CRP-like cAMP-binding protein
MAYDVTWLAAHEESLVDENLLGVGRRSAAERIASFLVQIYRRALPLYGDNGEGVPFPINQQHISDALGLSIVHTNKTLRKLAKQGFYEIVQGRLKLLDIKALKVLGDISLSMNMPPRRLI